MKISNLDEEKVNHRIEAPIADGSSFEGVLSTIREFNVACQMLKIINGIDLFNNFQLCLTGNAKEEWEIVTKDVTQFTKTKFDEYVCTFIWVYMMTESRTNLLDYIQSV